MSECDCKPSVKRELCEICQSDHSTHRKQIDETKVLELVKRGKQEGWREVFYEKFNYLGDYILKDNGQHETELVKIESFIRQLLQDKEREVVEWKEDLMNRCNYAKSNVHKEEITYIENIEHGIQGMFDDLIAKQKGEE